MSLTDYPVQTPSQAQTQTPPHSGTRLLLAALLRAASQALDRIACGLLPTTAVETRDPVIEFHADAGAPEGALYVNGELVGHVLGVTRL